jgi:hypothetical protein
MYFKGLADTDACGSCLVLPTSVIKDDLFGPWKLLACRPLPGDLHEATLAWNVIAAGAFDLEAIMTGLRARELRAPSCLCIHAWPSVEIQRQKGRLVAAYYPQRYRAYLSCIYQRSRELQRLLLSNKVDVNLGGLETVVFYHLELAGGLLSATGLPSTPETARTAFAQHPDFLTLADWNSKWPRHWTNTVLRDAGLHENLVQRFHNHAPESFYALRWDQTPAVDIELHEYICAYLSALLGL